MPNFARLVSAALVTLSALTSAALAGDPVRLLVEPTASATPLEPGQSIDVQIVGQDAAGVRGGFAGHRVEVSATEGELVLVQAPYRYRYVAPAQIDADRLVLLRAWLKQLPDVKGSATVQIAAPRPYQRIAIRGPATAELGTTAMIEVVGVRPDGTTTIVRDQPLVVSLDGPGTLYTTSPGVRRYSAPPRTETSAARKTAKIVASLERFPSVSASLSILLTRDAAPVPPTAPPAGDVTRIGVELPQGVTTVEAGQALDVEITAFDAAGRRVGLGDRRVEVSATEGELVLVTAPGRCRYTAPAVIERPGSALLRAWLKQSPGVSGSATLQLLPPRPFSRLVFRGANTVEPGRSIDLEVIGMRPDGTEAALRDQRVLVTLDGPGTVTTLPAPGGASVHRYATPLRWDPRTDGRNVRLMATLERYPAVNGETTLAIGRAAPPSGPAPDNVSRLVAELPPGLAEVELGQSVDFQVFGADASGNRVLLGDRQVEASATVGDVSIVEGTSRWRYTAPAMTSVADRTADVRVWLKRTPEVNGSFGLRIRARSGLGRLELRGPAAVELGTWADIEVFLTGRDGVAARAENARIWLATDGPGAIDPVSPGVWRYTAPPRTDVQAAGRTVRITASNERIRSMTGAMSLLLTAEPVAGENADEDAAGVLWPGGNVRLLVWRSRPAREDPWPRETFDLPAPGRPLLAPGSFVRLRIQPEREDIAKIELESWIGDRPGAAVRIDDADPSGRLRLVKNKLGRTHAIVETELPDSGKPLVLRLLLTTTKGEILTEDFVVAREVMSRR